MNARIALMAAALALAGCEAPQSGLEQSPRPAPRPAGLGAYEPSAESRNLRMFYTLLEQDLKVRGLMRIDGGAVDAPFTDRMLAENFLAIAFFDENPGNRLDLSSTPAPLPLVRWSGPVRVGLTFGASVPDAARAAQRAQARAYVARLAEVTGHPISFQSQGDGNFSVYVVDEDERRALAQELRARSRWIDGRVAKLIADLPRDTYCVVLAFPAAERPSYERAIAVIRSELPPASWRSCLHEELAQGLGLPNDSPRARPSIFNDDEEFALLTRHDELLLAMLYDARLRPGITAEDAAPLVRALAAEAMGADAS